MSKHGDSQGIDDEHTDQLPVLLETVVFEDRLQPLQRLPVLEDTAEHPAAAEDGGGETAALRQALDERTASIERLTAEVGDLAARCRSSEASLGEKQARIAELTTTVTSLRESLEARSAIERELSTKLTAREVRVTELEAQVADMTRLRAGAEAAQQETVDLRQQVATLTSAPPNPAEIQRLLEENATLSSYIANRGSFWDELEARHASLSARVVGLEHELSSRSKKMAALETLASGESARAVKLRAALVVSARSAEQLQRELAATRTVPAGDERQSLAANAEAANAGTARPPVSPAAPAAPPESAGAASAPPVRPPLEPDTTPDVVAHLEAEVQHKRQQISAQLVELRDREQKLAFLGAELDALRRDNTALHADLEQIRTTVVDLEHAVLDKDRALEARDARVASLQAELNERLGALQALNARDLSIPAPNAMFTDRRSSPDADVGNRPALICLSGDAPKQFPLNQKVVTLGRGPTCDLQIVTHFVSREHARIVLSGSAAVIEDLGSTNGVFVNSVRIERCELRQGDLITVGETQFRFLESMTH